MSNTHRQTYDETSITIARIFAISSMRCGLMIYISTELDSGPIFATQRNRPKFTQPNPSPTLDI